MGSSERRAEILRTLCRRRYETIGNLANEFGVSERTILRDIEIISLSEPIYTKQGKYAGGVYVIDGFSMSRMYMSEEEISVLKKIMDGVESNNIIKLDPNEYTTFKNIITQYTKPTYKKG